MDVSQGVNMLGLSPEEIGAIDSRNIQRNRNVISMLGAVSTAQRNRTLDKKTEVETGQLEPVTITHNGKQYQTTKRNMIESLANLSQMDFYSSKQQRTDLDNEMVSFDVGGKTYNTPRYQQVALYEELAKNEQRDIDAQKEDRLNRKSDLYMEGIGELEKLGPEGSISASTAAKVGALPSYLNQGSSGPSAADEANQLRLMKEYAASSDTSSFKNPTQALAAMNMVNTLGEKLGQGTAKVVFLDTYKKDGIKIKKGIYTLPRLINPDTGKLMQLSEVRQIAEMEGIPMMEALRLLWIEDQKREQE